MAPPSPPPQPPPALSFLSFILGPLVLLWGLLRRWRTPSPSRVPAMPSLLELYGRVAAGALKPKLPPTLQGHPLIEVAVDEPLVVDPARLATYLALVKYDVPVGAAAAKGGAVVDAPAAFLFAEAFRVGMLAMAQPSFPFNVLGAVLSRSRLRLERPVRVGDQLLLSARIDPSSYRRNAKGDVEAVVATFAHEASGGGGGNSTKKGELVWSSDLTVLVLDPKRGRGGGGGGDAGGKKAAAKQKQAGSAGDAPFLVLAPELRIGGDAGRRYGALSGDRNPIHLTALTAKLFGFSKPIAHAMYLVGCMEAALRSYEGGGGGDGERGPGAAAGGGGKKGAAGRPFGSPRYPLVLESEFKRPTAIPAKLRAVLASEPGGKGDAALDLALVELRGKGGAGATVMIKDVILGSLKEGCK
jgi:hypothetical protein